MNRRYIASLAVAAVLVLGVGSLIRLRLREADAPAPVAPPSQASLLGQLSREGQLRTMSGFVAERVNAVAPYVVYLPSTGTSGVRWVGDTVLATGRAQPVVVRTTADAAAAKDSARGGTVVFAPDTVRRDWLLVVGRDADGSLLSSSGLSGGRTRSDCAGRVVESYVLSAPLDPSLAGAGVFNLEGQALGMAVRCGERVVAIPAREVVRLLVADAAESDAVGTPYGLIVAPATGTVREYVGSDTGLLVTGVARGGAADLAGLRAGDVLLRVGDRAADAGAAVALMRAAPGDTLTLVRRRGRSTATARLVPRRGGSAGGGLGLGLGRAQALRGVPVAVVEQGSAAAAAGLRPGDRIVRVGETAVATIEQTERLLRLATQRATLVPVVFDREGVERLALLAGRPPAQLLPGGRP